MPYSAIDVWAREGVRNYFDFKHVVEMDNKIYKNVCSSIIVYIMADTVLIIYCYILLIRGHPSPCGLSARTHDYRGSISGGSIGDINQRGGDKRDIPLMLSVSVLL